MRKLILVVAAVVIAAVVIFSGVSITGLWAAGPPKAPAGAVGWVEVKGQFERVDSWEASVKFTGGAIDSYTPHDISGVMIQTGGDDNVGTKRHFDGDLSLMDHNGFLLMTWPLDPAVIESGIGTSPIKVIYTSPPAFVLEHGTYTVKVSAHVWGENSGGAKFAEQTISAFDLIQL